MFNKSGFLDLAIPALIVGALFGFILGFAIRSAFC